MSVIDDASSDSDCGSDDAGFSEPAVVRCVRPIDCFVPRFSSGFLGLHGFLDFNLQFSGFLGFFYESGSGFWFWLLLVSGLWFWLNLFDYAGFFGFSELYTFVDQFQSG
ncbi:hypothetical protein CYMTET_53561 [Cymbomonas tetramitiformis]|uniref:Uncharacterized protein n=1 Tax=Cymbomonas tetramitiformis TaxID=36881 RepID=A0AAE0EQG8_9CHLO|nr:hypothetical protein CYMTET_53561 [Cymbomonas tetramitiformis]